MGATQEELAEAVSVTRQTIIAIEKGNYTPSVLLALKIAHFFNQHDEKVIEFKRTNFVRFRHPEIALDAS